MSKVNFYIEIKRTEQSILKVSENIIASLRLLLDYDGLFKTAHFLHKKNITSINVTDENSVRILADNILIRDFTKPAYENGSMQLINDIIRY